MKPPVPGYFDAMIAGFHRGNVGRHVHLGHWEEPGTEPPRINEVNPVNNVPHPSHSTAGLEAAREQLCQKLLGMAGLANGQSILDVGCGFGGTLQAINSQFSSMDLTGLNIDPRQLAICAELLPANDNRFHWIEGDACQLPVPNSTYERVFCVEAMFHFSSRRRFFQEAARVLKPGGILVASDIVLTLDPAALPMPAFTVEAALVDGYGPWPDVWSRDADHVGLARDAGLQLTQRIDVTAETRPSHSFTVPVQLDGRSDPRDACLRAGLMLKWLHENGGLRYLYLAAQKPV